MYISWLLVNFTSVFIITIDFSAALSTNLTNIAETLVQAEGRGKQTVWACKCTGKVYDENNEL